MGETPTYIWSVRPGGGSAFWRAVIQSARELLCVSRGTDLWNPCHVSVDALPI